MRLPFLGGPERGGAPASNARGVGVRVRRLSVLEGHALWAATYDNDPNPLLALEERELEALLPDLRESFVLDVACGTGRWLARLVRRGARRGVGLDLSTEMLRRADEKPALRGRILRADCLSLPIRESVADLILCSFAVGYIGELHGLSHELARVSRPGAEVFLTDFHPAGHMRGWKRAFRYDGEVIEISSLAHSIEQIVGAFEAEGFTLLNCLFPCLGESERWIFEGRRKAHQYEAARQSPAIFICHFRLSADSPEGRVAS
jgi:SAM-dependent methyltransferase